MASVGKHGAFWELVDRRLGELEMTGSEFARRIGVSRPMIEKYKKQGSMPRAERLPAVAKALQVPLETLVAAAGDALEAVVVPDDLDPEWQAAVDAYLESDYADGGVDEDIVAQLRRVDHKSFRLRAGVLRDVHRARELLETQAREISAEGHREPVDERGYGLGRPRPAAAATQSPIYPSRGHDDGETGVKVKRSARKAKS